jgi:hypothetical protein
MKHAFPGFRDGRVVVDDEDGFHLAPKAEEATAFADGLQLNFGMRDQRRDWFDFLAPQGLISGSLDPP